MVQIIWSEEAKEDYHQNIDYLLSEWSEKSASEFIEEVDTVLELIKTYPKIYPASNYRSARKAVIRKQITLFYKIGDDGIYLLRFWNNHQDPGALKL